MMESRHITDAQTMRAMAHPVRLELLDLMRRDGEITASRAAELLGESPGNMSWHLQTLAKYGFVEEAGGGKGRSRPWRLIAAREYITTSADDPVVDAAADVLVNQVLDRDYAQVRQFLATRSRYPQEWQAAPFVSDTIIYLTANELIALREEISGLLDRHAERTDPGKRPEGALPVHVGAHGHPLPPTESGN
jgi:DNA-binding transcriptional ArsR family regulator